MTLSFDLSGPALDAAIAERGRHAAAALHRRHASRGRARPVRLPDGVRAGRRCVAAPTAGLHFTPGLLAGSTTGGAGGLRHPARGRGHVPADEDRRQRRTQDASEWGEVNAATAERLNAARRGRADRRGGYDVSAPAGERGGRGWRHPPFRGRDPDLHHAGLPVSRCRRLMTNFHLPNSTLFMLVSAFAGLEVMRARMRTLSPPGTAFTPMAMRACSGAPADDGVSFQRDGHRRDRADGRNGHPAGRSSARRPSCPSARRRTVKAVTVEHVDATGADIILGNTYHLMLRPTAERVARLGGLHRFMRWEEPVLTNSGGFQVMSLRISGHRRGGVRSTPTSTAPRTC